MCWRFFKITYWKNSRLQSNKSDLQVWFYFGKQQCENATCVLSRSLYIWIQRCLYCIANNNLLVLVYSSCLCRVCVAPGTIAWTPFPILNREHCYSCFLVLISEAREIYLSTWKCRYLPCGNSERIRPVLSCGISLCIYVTTWKSPSHTNWRVIHVQDGLMINCIKDNQWWQTALVVIDPHCLKWHTRRDPSSVLAPWAELFACGTWTESNAGIAGTQKARDSGFAGLSERGCMLNKCIVEHQYLSSEAFPGRAGREEGMQQNALGEVKSVWFCSTLGHLLHVKS